MYVNDFDKFLYLTLDMVSDFVSCQTLAYFMCIFSESCINNSKTWARRLIQPFNLCLLATGLSNSCQVQEGRLSIVSQHWPVIKFQWKLQHVLYDFIVVHTGTCSNAWINSNTATYLLLASTSGTIIIELLKKYKNKFDCLLCELLFIRISPKCQTYSPFMYAQLFVWVCIHE